MLLTNHRLDKLAACRIDFKSRGMLSGSCPAAIPPEPPPILPPADDGDSDPTDGPQVLAQVVLYKKRGTAELLHMSISASEPNWCIVLATGYPRFLPQLADSIHYPQLPILVRHFLFDQLYPRSLLSGSEVPLGQCPNFRGRVSIFKSAIAMFYAPSDQSGVGSMIHQRIRATKKWRQDPPHYDLCICSEGCRS